MFYKAILLLFITTVSYAKSTISYEDEMEIYEDLRAEKIITNDAFNTHKANILRKRPLVHNKTLGGTGEINGHVENTTGTALEAQSILLHEILAGEQDHVASTTTDASGDYSFTGLNPGTYIVYQGTFDDIYLNYMWDSGTNVICYVYNGLCRTPGITNHIVLGVAETTSGIDFTPLVGGTVNGSLKDALTSNPITSLSIQMVHPNSFSDYFLHADLDVATGNFSILGIPDGDYRIFTNDNLSGDNIYIPKIFGGPECNSCQRHMYTGAGVGTILTINSANTIDNIDFTFNVGASISGILVDSTTLSPLPNIATIQLFDESNSALGFQIVYGTDDIPAADGTYFLGGLIPGSYYVQGDGRAFYQRELYSNKPCYFAGCYRNLGDPVMLTPLENRVGIDFHVEKGGLVSGIILDTLGQPIPEFNNHRNQVEFIDALGDVIGGAFVNEDGTYTAAKGLPAGNYNVRTGSMFQGATTRPFVGEKYDNIPCPGIACDFSTPNVPVLIDATTTAIDFELATGNSFTGIVTDLASSAPIGGVHVLVYKDMGGGTVQFANWATTSKEALDLGTFEVTGLPDGSYYARTGYGSDLPFFVSTFHNIGDVAPIGWIDILYDSMPCLADCDVSLGTEIVLPAVGVKSTSATTETIVNFALNQGTVITGLVVDFINKAALKEVTINVYNDQGTFMGSSVTNDQGEYITRGLPDGTYYLTTLTDDVMLDVKYGNEFCLLPNCDPLDATPITVSGLTTATDKDFVLKTAYMHMFSNDFE